MGLFPRPGIRHPLFTSWKTTAAVKAAGVCVAMAGGFEELVEAAARGVRISHAIFPVLPPDRPLLQAVDRDRLWTLFQVPVYSLVVDSGRRVLAYDCEAQNGLHLNGWMPDPEAVESSPCDCGRPGDRWIPGGRVVTAGYAHPLKVNGTNARS